MLHVTPYYNKPTQDGLFAHFAAIAENTALPIILYNIPGRSIVDMTPETMGRLAEIDNIVGVKDATADMAGSANRLKPVGRISFSCRAKMPARWTSTAPVASA